MSILHQNQTLSYIRGVAPKLWTRTYAAVSAARHDRLSTRPAHVPWGTVNFVVDTPVLPVSEAAFERLLDEEQRDGVRLRFERRRGNRVAVIDLVQRQNCSFQWLYNYTIAATTDGDFCFVPKGNAGPVIEITSGGFQRRPVDSDDRDRVLSMKVGEHFLTSLIKGR